MKTQDVDGEIVVVFHTERLTVRLFAESKLVGGFRAG